MTNRKKSSDEEKTRNPIFKTEKIEKASFSDDKILRDRETEVVGRVSADTWEKSKQIVEDHSGKRVGSIEQDVFNEDVQVIRGRDGEKKGEITTNWLGERVIKDSEGKKVGTITKNIWGETIIRKEREYEEQEFHREEEDRKEELCPTCGNPLENGYCEECEDEEEEEDEKETERMRETVENEEEREEERDSKDSSVVPGLQEFNEFLGILGLILFAGIAYAGEQLQSKLDLEKVQAVLIEKGYLRENAKTGKLERTKAGEKFFKAVEALQHSK